MQDLNYDFGYGEQFAYSLFLPSEVGLARPEPGIYAWYVRSPFKDCVEDKCDPYRKVFSARRFQIKAKAPLGEELVGRVKRQQPSLKASEHQLHQELFANAFAVFAPAIYIGRSRDIRARLLQHIDALDEALAAPALLPSGDIALDADSDSESGQFGARVGTLLRSRGIKDSLSLFVKVAYAPDNDATKRVEYILNRTFHPVLGRL